MSTDTLKFQQDQRDKSRLPKTFTVTLSADQYHRLMPHLEGLSVRADQSAQTRPSTRNLNVAAAIRSLVEQLRD